jgi:hypothetical protein
VSIALGDEPPIERQFVLWLQASAGFADVRVPIDESSGAGTSCFAGVTSFDDDGRAPHLQWAHDVSIEPVLPGDEGDVEWRGDDLVERGVFAIDGALVPYEERWRREPGSDGEQVVLRAPADDPSKVTARWVRVGDHSLVIADRRAGGGDFSARYWRREDDGRWTDVLALGTEPIDVQPPDASGLSVGNVVEIGGLTWCVDEASAPG